MSSSDPPRSVEGIPPGGRIRRLVSTFIEAHREGLQPDVESYLPSDAIERREALVALVRIDIEHRLGAGETIRVENYLERFSELHSCRTTSSICWRRSTICADSANPDCRLKSIGAGFRKSPSRFQAIWKARTSPPPIGSSTVPI